MEQPEVQVLADKLDQLLERYGKLELENQALKKPPGKLDSRACPAGSQE
ncbi:MAG: hypothetical protein MH208_05880 [Marinobacter sp.]|nr:hypothetical protein [Marinobacter sp.]